MPYRSIIILVVTFYWLKESANERTKNVYTGKFSWQKYDAFDDIDDRFIAIQAGNCQSKPKDEMVFRQDSVSQIPKYNRLLSTIWYKNRTSLVHLHNMALNRAFFYSYILQKMNDTHSFHVSPNWMYMYMSTTADVNANPNMINGSAIYFDTNCSYPNWYTTMPFNKTLNLFAPKAWRWDDYNDQDNYLREPTKKVVMVTDMGAGRSANYTHSGYKMNPWYTKWLPDIAGDVDSLTKFTYTIGIKYSNETGRFTHQEFLNSQFFGPSSPSQSEKDERMLPVQFTQPYFDCSAAKKWVLSAVSPVVDYMPRYSNWTHLRRQRFVAAIVMDIDFNQIDYNACGVSMGNPGPSYLSGVARCKSKTTGCKHKMGYGFTRGGYVCVCKSGYHYPKWIDPPYQGDDIERATDDEYNNGFDCKRTGHRQVLPQIDQLEGVTIEGASSKLTSGGNEAKPLTRTFHSRRTRSVNTTEEDVYPTNQMHRAFIPPNPKTRKLVSRLPEEKRKTVLRQMVDSPKEEKENRKNTLTWAKYAHGKVKFISRKTIKILRKKWLKVKKIRQLKRSKRAPFKGPFDQVSFDSMMRIFRHKASVTAQNCHTKSKNLLYLAGDVGYGFDSQFEAEGRTALRLAHFVSNFLQNTSPNDNFGTLRGGGRLHMEHLLGEVLANVMANHKILSSGIFWDTHQFVNQDDSTREFFGPLAYKQKGSFYTIDSAGLPSRYVDEDWYWRSKSRWSTNVEKLDTYKLRPMVRSNPEGVSSVQFEYFPMSYKAPAYRDGFWTRPTFKCDGRVDEWVLTYVVPFFGLDGLKKKIQFK
ncbi:uncharacterized protein LOC121388465 isoform X2 [Gigantopelta aegis]|nr:uncharacterized protein LOC121388465 isoform X2 [Gigantopelta aegis]